MRHFLFLTLAIALFGTSSFARKIEHHRFAHTWHHYPAGTRCLRIEVLDDDLIHFEIYERREPNHWEKCLREDDMIWISPMVDGANQNNRPGKYFDQGRSDSYEVKYRQGYQGPTPGGYIRHGDGIETSELRVWVYNDGRCVSIRDKARDSELTDICAEELDQNYKFVRVAKKRMSNFYGVGNLFTRGHSANGDWKGINWNVFRQADRPGNMRGPNFHGGDPSTSQFPMVYALGPDHLNYGLFFDHQYQMSMDFTEPDRFTYQTYGDELRFFFMSGPDLKDLRKDFMELTGKPPVPPKSQFGHWTSKFGFKSWNEAEKEVEALRKAGYPLDGVALDLQWFGGRFGEPHIFRMGTLEFAEPEFANPRGVLPEMYKKWGVQFMPIEESYIDERLKVHGALRSANYRRDQPEFNGLTGDDGCFLARSHLDSYASHSDPDKRYWLWDIPAIDVNFKRTLQEPTVWWGRGGMLDHSNGFARHYWHQLKRRRLSEAGIFNHWLDLGEPEMFYEYAYYNGFPELFREWKQWDGTTRKSIVQKHGDIHNLYNLFWAMGIHEGYQDAGNATLVKPTMERLFERRYDTGPRHWTMSRAGTVGSQRYGAMWTGDTKGNFENFNGHLQSQLHMSLLGMDYYSGDVGGFFHEDQGRDPKNYYDAMLYKQWFATASLLDIPLRPHGWALEEGISYGAHVRGDPDSNRANLWRRYELIPYMYSLAHMAHRFAEPMFPPLVYHFQDDLSVRENGTEKMIGPSLIFRVVAEWRGHGKQEAREIPMYLPRGTWIDYESLDWVDSNGGVTPPLPLFRRERVPAGAPKDTSYFMNPLFAREGAIIPRMRVDSKTMNALGKRWGEKERDELIVRVFPSRKETSFTLYEDDGVSRSYLDNKVRETLISQQHSGGSAKVTIAPSRGGSYVGASDSRPNVVELVLRNQRVSKRAGVTLNGRVLGECGTAQGSCWHQVSPKLVQVRTEALKVDLPKIVEFRFE